ncbi:MAG: right-handed parallel beta-helix repeat-containing protein [Bacteroidales bacterium]|nr:right-handed parallel beta-helix repeat-containing protein [Bacteroidales bacterium]
MHGYAEDAVRLAEIDTINRLFVTSQPTLYGFGSGEPWQKWYAYNIREEISMQNEFYLDREGYILFPGADSTSVIEVSVLGDPMMVIENIADVTVEGIVFESSRGIGVYMENSTNCILTNCTFRNLGSVAVSVGRGILPFKELRHGGDGVPSSRILGNLLQYIYRNTIFDRKAGHNNGLIDCHIYNTGAGGVQLGGGDRVTLEGAGNFVVNCTIHDYNRIEKSYRAGVDISGVGNRISYCEIFDAPSMAILLHGNEHLIAFNDIHNVCLDIDDQGAIYYGRDPSERGIKIYYNYFHELGNEHRTTAVYHDDGACGADVFGNVFYRAGTIPVLIGGGSDNSYKNNIFIDCPLGIHVDNRFQNWSQSSLEKNGIIDQRLKAVNYSQPPYSDYYPALADYWKEDPSLPKRNIVSDNLFYNVDQLFRLNEEWLVIGENYTTDTDPGFTNPGVDFSLKKESQVFKELSGFENIPFKKIGPQKLKKNSYTLLDRLK